jgi:hypothetical protein
VLPPYIVVEDFFDGAREMRSSFDQHFADPHQKRGPSQQVWDYWYVPGLYTYLRTDPTRVLPAGLVDSFVSTLRDWTTKRLGMSRISPPWLSLYVDGCGQDLHNDSGNGRWGFVYSLTEWDERRFAGGETLILRDSGYWETEMLTRPGAGLSFYDLVPARFNQLLIFDDRLLHAVPRIQGSMAPWEGRVVLHGHIREEGLAVQGPLSFEEVERALAAALARVRSTQAAMGDPYHGCACVRLIIDAGGSVRSASTLSDRLYRTTTRVDEPVRLASDLAALLAQVRFPCAEGESTVIVPVTFGEWPAVYRSKS